MLVAGHTYPMPEDVQPQDYDVLFQKWMKARADGDYKRADELREWAEFNDGVTFIRDGINLYRHRDFETGEEKGTLVPVKMIQWITKFFDYLILAHPDDNTKQGLLNAHSSGAMTIYANGYASEHARYERHSVV